MADEENELLMEDGGDDEEERKGVVDEGLILQLSKRDSGKVIGQRSRQPRRSRRRSGNEGGRGRRRDSDAQPTPTTCGTKVVCALGIILLMIVSLAVGLAIGMFIGHSLGIGSSTANCPSSSTTTGPPPPPSEHKREFNWGDWVNIGGQTASALDWFDDVMTAENIRNNLKILTAYPHIAGSEENHILAQLIYKQWSAFNFDDVQLLNYSVLLSYPNSSQPNVLQLMQGSEVIYNATIAQERPLTPGEDNSTVAPPFNAYSGSGTAMGPLVYVNYGRIEDFFYLTRNLSLDLTNHICIARYGNIYRGDKARLAQRFNCSGLLIYSDPDDYAPAGVPVYPEGPSLPLYGVQRGSVINRDGDPLTPDVPAIDGFYRVPYSDFLDKKNAPVIPVQPVSYGDAVHFLSQLDDHDVPSDDWVGGLNITYKIVQSQSNTNYTMLRVNNYQERRTIYNVVAYIYGSVEPDRFVILGNHRDAWVFGGVDPNSGTAVLMELARTVSELRNKGDWRPGRTIVLCSWDAEEPGLIGSTEFVEDKGKLLRDGTVAYLNIDSAVEGSEYLSSQASPLIYQAFWNATQMVKSPDHRFTTVYDQWLSVYSKDYNGTSRPLILDLGSGSDYAPFLQLHGITCSSMAYANRTSYAVYHSVHDNFYWMSNFGDPTFSRHLAAGLIWIKLTLILSTDPVLPFDPRDYAVAIEDIFQKLQNSSGDLLSEQGISLSYLAEAISDFTAASISLYDSIQDMKSKIDVRSDENVVRIVNNQLMNIERALIHDDGLPGRSYFKHIIYAPSSVNSYGSSLFPGVSDSIFNAVNYDGSWDDVRRQLDFLRNHIRYATAVMAEPSLKYALLK